MSSFLLGGCSSSEESKPEGSKSAASLKKLSVDKVIEILKKDYDATEYDDSCTYIKGGHGYGSNYEFGKGFYITSDGNYSEDVNIKSFTGYEYLNMFEIRSIKDDIEATGADYVMFRKGDSDNPWFNVIAVYVEFSDADEAMKCFEHIMVYEDYGKALQSNPYNGPYFNAKGPAYYQEALKQRDEAISMHAGTWMAEALSKNATEKVITLKDIDGKNYGSTSDSAYFDYSLHWDLTVWGDRAAAFLDEPDYLSSEFFVNTDAEQQGVLGHKLVVEGNKLLLIEGYDLSYDMSKDSGDIEFIKDLCGSFGVNSPFDTDTCYDLIKYLLYVLHYWKLNQTRVNSVK